MTEPFYPAKPGDPISAEKWNDLQVKMRDEISSRISSHTHTGSAEGRLLTGDGIDPSSSLRVNQLDASVSLTVKGIDVMGRFTALDQRVTTLDQQKLPALGGSITGSLSVGGNVGIGGSPTAARLDIQGAARSGTHAQGRALYVTGEFGEADGVEFRHSNGIQGIGIGSNTLYAAGTLADQNLRLQARGNGTVQVLNAFSARGLLTVTGQPNGLARVEATGSQGWAELDLYSTAPTPDLRKWNIAVRGGDGVFTIRQLTDARAEKNIPLSIATNGLVAVKSLSVTGDNLGGKVVSLSVQADLGAAENGVEFRHSNGTQGIGFGFNTIYAAGSNPSQDLNLQARGDGFIRARVNPKQMQLERVLTTPGKILFLELFQSEAATADVYPSIRFHHNNRFWNRIEASLDRFHFKVGDLNNDAYIDLVARTVFVNGNDPAVCGQEPIRVIRGFVSNNGNTRGTGFSVKWLNYGVCEITFTRAFGSPPVVVATQLYISGEEGGDTRDNAVVCGVWNERVRVKNGDNSGNGQRRDFHFIAMG